MEIPDFATDEGVERVLVVVAHPDDIDFGTAGSVATWTDAGIEVTYCLVTSGEAGGDDRTMARADMAALREEEQTERREAGGRHRPPLPRLSRRSRRVHARPAA